MSRSALSRGPEASDSAAVEVQSSSWGDFEQPSSASPGALPASVRRPVEQTYGVDLSGTRVHTDSAAAESADALSAHAYTVGQDIFFASGAYQPGTREGDRLLAHELAHVAQGEPGAHAKAVHSEPGDAAEVEADQAADLAVANIYDSGQNKVQLSATPTATHMRKAKPTQKRSFEDEVARRQAYLLSMGKFPSRPGPDSSYANYMSKEGQGSSVNVLDREYPILSSLVPLLHSSCDRVTVIEYETGLSAGGASEAESFFAAAAKAAKSKSDVRSAADGLRTEKAGLSDFVEGTGVSGDDGLIGCVLSARAAQSDLTVALNAAKKEALEEKKETIESDKSAIAARYSAIIDVIVLATKVDSLIDEFVLGDAAELAGEQGLATKMAESSAPYKALVKKLDEVQGQLKDVRYNTIRENIHSAEDRLAKALRALDKRREGISKKRKTFRADYAILGERLDAANVKGGPETNDDLAEGHGKQIMMLIAAIRERAVMGRQLQGYWNSSTKLKDLEWQGMYQSKFFVETNLSHVQKDGSSEQNQACIRYCEDVKMLVGNVDHWGKQEAEWLSALKALTIGDVREY